MCDAGMFANASIQLTVIPKFKHPGPGLLTFDSAYSHLYICIAAAAEAYDVTVLYHFVLNDRGSSILYNIICFGTYTDIIKYIKV